MEWEVSSESQVSNLTQVSQPSHGILRKLLLALECRNRVKHTGVLIDINCRSRVDQHLLNRPLASSEQPLEKPERIQFPQRDKIRKPPFLKVRAVEIFPD